MRPAISAVLLVDESVVSTAHDTSSRRVPFKLAQLAVAERWECGRHKGRQAGRKKIGKYTCMNLNTLKTLYSRHL